MTHLTSLKALILPMGKISPTVRLDRKIVLLDFTAAFDLIDHELLIKKLVEYGFKSPANVWIENYLANRQQCVSFNGSLSNVETLKCGLPQGSCLGSLLYAVFINDLPKVLEKASVAMYADDTTI